MKPPDRDGLMPAPTVSLCMPTYNYARYLKQAIESALCQTYQDFELVVIDDCSTDRSREIIQEFAVADRRIVFHENESNLGMVANWNRCLRQARGKYVKFLFADDIFATRDALEKMVHVMDSDAALALVASARYILDEHTKIIELHSHYSELRSKAGTEIIKECLIDQQNKIGEPSVVMFRVKHAGRGFNPQYKQLADLEMWFHLLEQGNFAFIEEPLVGFRRHPSQVTASCLAAGLDIYESFLLLRDYAIKPYVDVSRAVRIYMSYVPLYRTWQRYAKHRQLTRKLAIHEIRATYGVPFTRFLLKYPGFKLLKFCRTALRQLRSRMRRDVAKSLPPALPIARCLASLKPRFAGNVRHV